MMIPLFKRLLNEPAIFLSAVAAGVQLAIFLPDWRAGVVAAVQLLAGAGTRKLVSPSRG